MRPLVEDLSKREDLGFFKLGSLQGTRDGDRLDVQAMFTDSSSTLILDLHFKVAAQATLASGTWRWNRNNQILSGSVMARSVSFLGGQAGPPSIGGSYDLTAADGLARYRVTIPLTELRRVLKVAPDWQSHPSPEPRH
jgi:hypothetical protein